MSPAGASGTPLAGQCVVVTRAEAPGGPLGTKLAGQGAEVRHWPVVRISPPADSTPLVRALDNLAEYDWIIFSSPRAVAAVTGRVDGPPAGVRVAVVGESTAESLMEQGWPVDLLPRESGSEGLVAAFSRADFAHGAEVLFPASSIARATIPDGLTDLGARVDRVVAYETTAASLDSDVCLADADSGGSFYGNLTFVQDGIAFHPSNDNPYELGVIRGRLGRLENGSSVLGYVVLPERLDPSHPIDVYWNDRLLTATFQP